MLYELDRTDLIRLIMGTVPPIRTWPILQRASFGTISAGMGGETWCWNRDQLEQGDDASLYQFYRALKTAL